MLARRERARSPLLTFSTTTSRRIGKIGQQRREIPRARARAPRKDGKTRFPPANRRQFAEVTKRARVTLEALAN